MTVRGTISLCMITKDEEDWLEQCLLSVKGLVSEIVLVDTGSTDRTVEIARSQGARVLFEEWSDDFSRPRNTALSHATGQWVLVLDADEAIAREDHSRLRCLTTRMDRCYSMVQRHYQNNHRAVSFVPCRGEYPEWERDIKGYAVSSLCRMFPNGFGIRYQGRVHELVEPSILALGRFEITPSGVPIHHYGHTEKVLAKKNKPGLYSALSEKKAAEAASWKSFHELGLAYITARRYADAVGALAKALEFKPGDAQSLLNLGYCLCELQRFDEAIEIHNQALVANPFCAETHCNLGVIYMRVNRPIFAQAHLERAVTLSPGYINAYCNLAQVQLRLGAVPEAVAVLRKALECAPECQEAKADLAAIYARTGRVAEALQLASEVPDSSPVFSRMSALRESLERRVKSAGSTIAA